MNFYKLTVIIILVTFYLFFITDFSGQANRYISWKGIFLFLKGEFSLKSITKKFISAVTALGIVASSAGILSIGNNETVKNVEVSAASSYNYGEALQKSLFFYQVQQSGPIADWNQVQWRDDCMENDFVTGGWFDAGDHIKFAVTNAYSASMLAWGLIEYEQGLKDSGLLDLYKKNLQFALDYLVNCDLGDEVVYQIGDIGFDHKWWGAAEVYLEKLKIMEGEDARPYFTTKDSYVTGQMAAALAAGYMVFKDSDPTLAATYLKHAENCFKIADTTRDGGNTPASDAMYKSSHFYDELFWAANWLYRATKDQKYLDLCKSDYIPNLGLESQSTELKYTWGHCWDDVQQGGTLLYAMNTGDEEWIKQVQKHLEYWTTGYGGKKVDYTPDGLAWLMNWGSLRHTTTTAFLAYVAADNLFKDDSASFKKYIDFADSQMNYCFGDNGRKSSYVVGMGENYPKAWHHRTSSGIWNDNWNDLGTEDGRQHAHVLYGALVGGPGKDGSYNDAIAQYEYTEVAIDYNAGYTAALCAMVEKYGGTIDPAFPPTETPKWDEFYIEACINQASASYIELKVMATNHTAWPARTVKDLSYNYYMDFTELFDAGLTVDDVSVKIGSDEFKNCTISEPIQYDGNIYYVKISYADGTCIMPTGQSEHQGEVQFRVSVDDKTPVWDSENDYSFAGLVKQDLSVAKNITMYDGDTLIWGVEPDGTKPSEKPPVKPEQTTTSTTTATNPPATVTTSATTSSTSASVTTAPSNTNQGGSQTIKYGDINGDNAIDLTDLTLLSLYLLGDSKLDDTQLKAADVSYNSSVDLADLAHFKQYISKEVGIVLGPQ